MNVSEEREERERLLKELEKKHEMTVSHMSKEEFEKYVNSRQRKKKSKKSKAKRCKCK